MVVHVHTSDMDGNLQSVAGAGWLNVTIVGSGPVGMRAAHLLSRLGHAVTVLSQQTVEPYNRVRLTPLLSGDVQFGEILLSPRDTGGRRIQVHLGRRVVGIRRDPREVVTADGASWPYDRLVLATGSSAFVPGIPGTDLPGVMTFRTAADASALLARSISARRVAVIGGGLLGLEAARGMRRRQCAVTVIEHEGRLMPRQLDPEGGALLAERIVGLGVEVRTGVAVRRITGSTRVEALELATGERLPCDTVIVCTGVRANIGLARDAGLAFDRGIVVDDTMRTSDPHIYAVGECAQIGRQVFGLVGPGYVQAETAAAAIDGQPSAFPRVVPATKLKVIGADVFSVGEIEQLEVRTNVRSHVWRDGSGYRRIFVERGRLAGALAVGAWAQASQVQDAVQAGVTVYPWMIHRFRRSGALWPDAALELDELPDAATLCNCTGATYGQVRGTVARGADSVEAVGIGCGAGTVCGSCKPVLAEMLDAGAGPAPVPLWRPVLGLSFLALLGAVLPLLAGHVPLPSSFDPDSLRVWLWQDKIVKQWSGYILLGITVAACAIGLRKRWRITDRLGGFDGWRMVHIGIGIMALAGLFAHTGFKLGSNWNAALGWTFLAVLGIGALAGLATGGDHALRARRIGTSHKPPRGLPVWLHVIALWPLPVLIGLHVLVTYAY